MSDPSKMGVLLASWKNDKVTWALVHRSCMEADEIFDEFDVYPMQPRHPQRDDYVTEAGYKRAVAAYERAIRRAWHCERCDTPVMVWPDA